MPRALFARLVLLLAGVLVLTTAIGLLALRASTRDAATQYTAHSLEARLFMVDAALAQGDADAAVARLRELGIDRRAIAPAGATPRVPYYRQVLRDLAPRLAPRRPRIVEAPEPVLWIEAARAEQGWIGIPLLNLNASLRWSTALWVAAALAIVFCGAAWYARTLVRPLRDLARAAPELLAGAPPPPLPAGAATELVELSAAFARAGADTRAAAQERQLLLAGLSHDMRTPLARLVVALELLDGDAELRAGMAADIAELDAILDQFIAFVRDGRDEAAQMVDLAAMLDAALAAQQRGGRAWSRVGDETVRMYAKPLALRRALDNLLENAVRHGAAPYEVELRALDQGAALIVRDRGQGVPQPALANLGKPFYRADPARSGCGSGLGLATAQRVAAWHGGALALRNRGGGGFEAELRVFAARA